ncbi:MAG: sulfotransferase [Candidatus Electrothrix sp. GW3-4]|uniref:sulfotransferase family protein n=1 Tax=Candidatus Electrothrix sp. GW3-4 TaxID=3126740 RepID=UPI0030D41B07
MTDIMGKTLKKIGKLVALLEDSVTVKYFSIVKKWPCDKKVYLMVGSESSGTTAIANLLFLEIPGFRFLEEGEQQWVWEVYQDVYRKTKKISDYPKLVLFDAIKVPGFATIIPEFKKEFPRSKVIYIVRDPRDYVNSAIKTWKVSSVEELSSVSWVKENWLNIKAIDPIERLALRWQKYITAAMRNKDVFFVRYEDFCVDKVVTIEKIAMNMELPFNKMRVSKLCDKQLCHKSVRAYKPQGPGGWRVGLLNKAHIAKIENICRTEMLHWGYKLSIK